LKRFLIYWVCFHILFIFFLGGLSLCYAGDAHLPNKEWTPGALDKIVHRDVTVEDVCYRMNGKINPKFKSTITVRHVTPSVRKRVYQLYNDGQKNHKGICEDNQAKVAGKRSRGCEVDHLCPLSLGCNNHIKNLWLQPYFGEYNAHMKDKLENKLYHDMCKGKITMEQAQFEISDNWINAYNKRIK
jgi:hypothetical protein